MIGNSLGPYKILEPLGAGGMGEVFLAEDTRLDRKVAIKVLSEDLAADPERLARFEREAKLLASLNHANIAAIYGLEGSGEQSFIAMEFVEGETLADRIGRGAVPLEEALVIARQIADALEAAHDKGIIHRDLKPANVMVTEDGTVKVLDFGLAKAYFDDAPAKDASPEISASPTILAATGAGIILGTAAYMSPEQAKGHPLDRRADVWAFGVVLFEMLTGKRAFSGADVTEVIAAVIRDVPDLDTLPEGSPAALRRLLRRCLEKDPAKRLRDIGDAGLEIDEALAPGGEPAGETAAAAGGFTWMHAMAAGALVVITAAAAWMLKPEPEVDRSITRFLATLDASEGRPNINRRSIVISPDGRRVVYRAAGEIYGRALDALESRLIASETSNLYDVSPDSERILFSTADGLMATRIAGGPTQTLVSRPSTLFVGAAWGDDGTVVYADGEGIWVVSGDGGAPRQVVSAEGAQLFTPSFLPGSAAVLYTRFEGSSVTTMVASLDGTTREVLVGGGAAVYVSTGHLLYLTEDGLAASPFDLATQSTTGPVVLLSESVAISTNGLMHVAVADNGTLVYFPNTGGEGFDFQLSWVDAEGRSEQAFADLQNYSDLRLSADGRRVAVHFFEGQNDIWTLDLVTGRSERITFEAEEDETPIWSPDGLSLAYASNRNGQRVVFLKRADSGAGGQETPIWEGSEHIHLNDWAAERGKLIAEIRRPESNDIIAIDVETGDETTLVGSSFNEKLARLSPDGNWLAYVSDETGDDEVWVLRYPELDSRVPVSTDGGTEPVWSADGQTLYFRSEGEIMAAQRLAGDVAQFGVAEAVFADTYLRTQGTNHFHFDVAADGRFLFVTDPSASGAGNAQQQYLVVLNWGEELKRLAPSAGR